MSAKAIQTAGSTGGRPSPHPGILLRQIVLPALGISVSEAAKSLAVTRQSLHRILAGTSAITPVMATRLEKFCGVPATFWLDRQRDHELHLAHLASLGVLPDIRAYHLPEKVLIEMGVTSAHD